MHISTTNQTERVQITHMKFSGSRIHLFLSDTREIDLDIDRIAWLQWLAKATPQQRDHWSIEPGGYAIYWDELDDGIELEHLLCPKSLI